MSKRAELRRQARAEAKEQETQDTLVFYPDWETRFRQHAFWCERCKQPKKLMKRGCRAFDRLVRDYYMAQRTEDVSQEEETTPED